MNPPPKWSDSGTQGHRGYFLSCQGVSEKTEDQLYYNSVKKYVLYMLRPRPRGNNM